MIKGFDNDKYINLQSEAIKKRISKFGNKLYMEFGGKLFNDLHATRVLPGFEHDAKLKMLLKLKNDLEMIVVINALDIKNKKIRADINLTYEEEVFRLIDKFKKYQLEINSVIITQYENNQATKSFINKLAKKQIKVIKQYKIKNYPHNVDLIVSENGFGKNEYAKTTKNLIVITAPGPGSGKLSAILSQLYHDHQRKIKSSYTKFETFPIWNLDVKHPVNLAYEAATIDLNDLNMIDFFHQKAYGIKATNYNRDLEAFPILNKLLETIYKKSFYQSPTDMGVNMAGFCIIDDNVVSDASKKEIIRRYYHTNINYQQDKSPKIHVKRLLKIIKDNKIDINLIKSIEIANDFSLKNNRICSAIEINENNVIIGKESNLLNSNSAAILNVLKYFAKIDKNIDVLEPKVIALVQNLKNSLHYNDLSLDLKETLFALSVSANNSEVAKKAFNQIKKLSGLFLHRTAISSDSDHETLKNMEIRLTEEIII